MDLLEYLWLIIFTVGYTLHGGVLITWAETIDTKEKAKAYLTRYNYNGLPDVSDSVKAANLVNNEASFRQRILEFQSMWHLNVTGFLDDATIQLMSYPRCGVRDINNVADLTRKKKRYILQGTKWHKSVVTYKIHPYPRNSRGLTSDKIDQIMAEAFAVWQSVTLLTFTQAQTTADTDVDIIISFLRFWHGDEYPFDGYGGTLAHAFFPEYSGNVHFDDHEVWTMESQFGTNLFQVAAHEIGHSIGLAHSYNTDALMAPFYSGYKPNFKLHSDDIRAIQALYGMPVGFSMEDVATRNDVKNVPSNVQNPSDKSPQCEEIVFDVITSHMEDGKVNTYAFFGEYFTRINNYGMVPGYPKRISWEWPELPADLDAAVYWEPEYEEEVKQSHRGRYEHVQKEVSPARTYFFKGNQYWRFQNKKASGGYPRLISNWFHGLPDNLDAAFVWGRNGMTYFIKGGQYYRYTRGSGVDYGYPRPLTVWKDLPPMVTTAFKWDTNNKTYFFNGKEYYRFNDQLFGVSEDYPRTVEKWWLNCHSQGLMESNTDPTSLEAPDTNINSALNDSSVYINSVESNHVTLPLISIFYVFLRSILSITLSDT